MKVVDLVYDPAQPWQSFEAGRSAAGATTGFLIFGALTAIPTTLAFRMLFYGFTFFVPKTSEKK